MFGRIIKAILSLLLFTSAVCAAAEIKPGAQFPPLNLRMVREARTVVSRPPKFQIVAFVTTWSKSSLAEVNAFQELNQKYAKRGVEIIAVSFDSKPLLISNFAEKQNLSFKVLFDEELTSPGRYQISVIPTTFVIGSNGLIKNIFLDFDDDIKKAIESSVEE